MQMRQFLNYLKSNKCEFIRYAKGGHAIYSLNGKTASIPANHRIMSPGVKRKVCQTLGIPNP